MTSVDEVFAGDSRAHLVAGRAVRPGGDTVDSVRRSCERVDAWAAGSGVPVVLVVSGDFSDTTGQAGTAPVHQAGVLGVPVLTVEDGLGCWPVEVAAVDAAVRRSGRLPWDDLLALLPAGWAADRDIGVYTAATGPLAGAVLACGVLIEGPSPDDLAYDPDAELELAVEERTAEPDLDLVEVCDSGQRVRSERVYGIEVVARSYWAHPTQPVDLSPAARAAHRARLGTLADRSSYQLMCHYDD